MSDYILVNGELYHHGVKGMRWGNRRYQNTDGSLTPAGKKRYVTVRNGVRNAREAGKEAYKKSMSESRTSGDRGFGSFRRANNKAIDAKNKAYKESIASDKEHNRKLREERKEFHNTSEGNAKIKKAVTIGAAVAATAIAAYGAYKVNKWVKDTHVKIQAERGHNLANKLYHQKVNEVFADINSGKIKSGIRLSSGASKMSAQYANSASKQKFGAAARNVIRYKKNGGNLRSLKSAQDWVNTQDLTSVWKGSGPFYKTIDILPR